MLILIAEDNPDVSKLLETAFQKQGHETCVLASGFGVVNRVAGRTGPMPQLLVLDHHMPALSGGRVLELLARDPVAVTVPVIVHSASSAAEIPTLEVHPRARYVEKGHFSTLLREVEAVAAQVVPVATTPYVRR